MIDKKATTMTNAQTASDAFDRYKLFYDDGRLIQKNWHVEQDGRQLACGLGVLGEDINSPSKCPAQIMPRWLAQLVTWLFDNQEPDDAFNWGLKFYAELKRLNGQVPFSVIHDWHANYTTVIAIETSLKLGSNTEVHIALQALHIKALGGDILSRNDWLAKLKPAFLNAYADANANANAYAYAYADAYAYANAYAYAYAYAYADAYAYAYANAYAYAYAYADADANSNADADADAVRKIAMKRLADGIVECLMRVKS